MVFRVLSNCTRRRKCHRNHRQISLPALSQTFVPIAKTTIFPHNCEVMQMDCRRHTTIYLYRICIFWKISHFRSFELAQMAAHSRSTCFVSVFNRSELIINSRASVNFMPEIFALEEKLDILDHSTTVAFQRSAKITPPFSSKIEWLK